MLKQVALGVCLAGAAGLMVAAGIQPEGEPPASQDAPPAAGGVQDMGQMLIDGLEATEGCLGVETPQFPDGRQSIMAWFENKAAVERWYYSPSHQFMMGAVGAGKTKPLSFVTDEKAPVMVIATIDFTGPPALPGPIPFSAISIELYTPLPGGAYIGKRLAPEKLEVPHMRNLEPAPAKTPEEAPEGG
ncbi:MAG: hypothetical protein DHS20C14_14980 [Phycisphaeraceae bacterium]|nr:MAG: hypothetical protein DHS20C14_14980 [Phycisphaeraceae bacterium]